MKVMGIDSATDTAAVGLIDDKKILGEVNLYLHHRHSERLLLNVKHLLEELQVEKKELAGLAVGLGPGSFTGLRIGVTTVKIMAQFLEVPVVGLSTLEILAAGLNYHSGFFVPMIDAHNKRVYTSLFSTSKNKGFINRHWSDRARTLEVLISELSGFDSEGLFYPVGDGALNYRSLLEASGLNFQFLPPEQNSPRGAVTAGLGYEYLKKGCTDSYQELVPRYMKEAHTTT